MPRLIITATADADAAGILTELSNKAGAETAKKFNARFESLYDRLVDHPDSGPTRPKLGPHIRIGLVFPYIVIYRHVPNDETVSIIRIVHGRRRLTRVLLQAKS